LQRQLPDYMLPSAFVFLETMPLLPNGKLDRRALPVPDRSHAEAEETYAPPRTHVEEQLTQIWAELLDLDRVGIHDNFFTCGGHSLLAMVFLARVSSIFRVELSVRTFFEMPTIAEIAAFIESKIPGVIEESAGWQVLAEIENLSDEEIDR